MELRVGCRRPAEEPVPGLRRLRLASRVIKGQPLGGTDDERGVIEPACQAVELAEQLHDDPQPGAPLFGRFAFYVRYRWFRAWGSVPVRAAGWDWPRSPLLVCPIGSEDKEQLITIHERLRPEEVLAAFDEHLRRTRGVCAGTRLNYARYAGAFLQTVSAGDPGMSTWPAACSPSRPANAAGPG
jgi:hypothetical protein